MHALTTYTGTRCTPWQKSGALAIALLMSTLPALATAPSSAPQVLLVVTNSQSMDGTTSGAIMVGSGSLGAGMSSLNTSSSPANYAVPSGFVPPINPGAAGVAPYTVACTTNAGYLCDNGPSRLNMAKNAIETVLQSYGNAMNFGLYTYNTGGASLYTTWVYLMSPGGGAFGLTNTSSATTVNNPCFAYTTASATVKSNCTSIATILPGIDNFLYLTTSVSSDDATVNDVLYASGLPAVMLDYGGPTNKPNPYPPNFTLAQYNSGSISMTYAAVKPSGVTTTSPTNAGFVPYSNQVMYAERGFGYYTTTLNATTGKAQVPMGSALDSNSALVATYVAALQPETNNAGTSEIKSLAAQSPMGGILAGAKSYLSSLNPVACQSQYVVMVTDGLPTLDLNNKAWPPLGTTSGNNYGVTATFNPDGSLAATNDQALTDAIASITSLKNAGIKVYIIGLGAGVNQTVNPVAAQSLTAMAVAGGTNTFFPANSQTSLNNAFQTIAQQIFSASALSAPVEPSSLTTGSLQYVLDSNPSPLSGTVTGYNVNANTGLSTTTAWEASALMSAGNRGNALYSTYSTLSNGSGTVQLLNTINAAAFALSPSTCVPSVSTIQSYTIDPSYSGVANCSYLAGRAQGAFLNTFSTQNAALHVGPPSTSRLLGATGYSAWAKSQSSRAPMLMFTNNDGFLYAIDASTGNLLWGWMPQSFLPMLQYYPTFEIQHPFDGNFTVVDAQDAGGNWASYVVGSAQAGKEHFSVKLTSSGQPSSVIYDVLVSGGTSPGDTSSMTLGSTPHRQIPQIAYLNGLTYAIYVVNTGTTSTLYEVNVATGVATSAPLTITTSSNIYLDAASSMLFVGTTNGQVWAIPITGVASTDATQGTSQVVTQNPATNATVSPVVYVGYMENGGTAYLYALNSSQITFYAFGATGWLPVWASTTTSGYKYASGAFTASAGIKSLPTGAVFTDLPSIDGNDVGLYMTVPAASACTFGTAYNGFYLIQSGGQPSDVLINNGTSTSAVTNWVNVGTGNAYTSGSSSSASGKIFRNPGSSGNTGGGSQNFQMPGGGGKGPVVPIGWRQR